MVLDKFFLTFDQIQVQLYTLCNNSNFKFCICINYFCIYYICLFKLYINEIYIVEEVEEEPSLEHVAAYGAKE